MLLSFQVCSKLLFGAGEPEVDSWWKYSDIKQEATEEAEKNSPLPLFAHVKSSVLVSPFHQINAVKSVGFRGGNSQVLNR
jgi:hypothetical protein